MSEQVPNENNISDELRKLGDTLNLFMKTAWESPERQHIQHELETGLETLSTSLNQAADEFAKSQAGQQVKSELEDFSQRLSNGEVETKVKNEVIYLLGKINNNLEQVANQWSTRSDHNTPPDPPIENHP